MKLRKISVKTIPNGYTLDVEGMNGFMYSSMKDLVDGFLYHVGMEMPNPCSKETIAGALEASACWKDSRKAAEEIDRLRGEQSALNSRIASLEHENESQKKRLCGIIEGLGRLSERKAITGETCLREIDSILSIYSKNHGKG